MTSRITTMIALASLLAPATGMGQDVGKPPLYRPASGMVLDGDEWRTPTVEDALHAVTLGRGEGILGPGQDGDAPAVALLRQTLGPRPRAELDALASALADMIIASESESDDFLTRAFLALQQAANPERSSGMPHAGSFEALVRVYETLATQVLAANDPDDARSRALINKHAGDPFVAARVKRNAGRLSPGAVRTLSQALWSLFWADREGRGGDYVLALIERSRVPEPCPHFGLPGREPCTDPELTAWCEATSLLHGDSQSEPLPAVAPDGLLPPPPPLGSPTLEDYYGPDPERYGEFCFEIRSH